MLFAIPTLQRFRRHAFDQACSAPHDFDKPESTEKCRSFSSFPAPQPADAARWQPTEIEFIRKSLDDLISKYNIDRMRIVAQGSQAGGAMAWLTALNHRDLIRAVAPFDTALPARAQVAANDPIERLAIYIAFPKNSKLADRIRAEVKQLETMKYPVLVQELEDDAKQLTEPQTQQLTRWIDTLDRL